MIKDKKDHRFLINAAPGSGKTICASVIAKNLIKYNKIDRVIVSGTIAILMIEIASTAWINFGKNMGIIFGNTVIPSIEIPIEIKIKIFFKFLFEIPLESCGSKYLKEI